MPLQPTRITWSKSDGTMGEVVASLSKQAGIPIKIDPAEASHKCAAVFEGAAFWDALERLARSADTRIVVHDQGNTIALVPRGKSEQVTAVSGAFRVAAKQVIGRALLDLGTAFHEVHLETNWEPRVPVYRIDTQPHITLARDDQGRPLQASAGSVHGHPSAAVADMTVKLTGITRESKKIGVLAGEFQVTAAEKLLIFTFDDLTAKLPREKVQDRVKARLESITRADKSWEVELELQYPEGHPVFESFEEQKWLRDNQLQLVSPTGKPIDSESEEFAASGRTVKATYRFPAAANPLARGWSLICRTPSPLVVAKIPFELKNIPLP
jgi:hypothetical protein